MCYSIAVYVIKFTWLLAVVLTQERCTNEEYEFLCPDGFCINREYVCDGSSDCIGGADETKDKCEFRHCSTATEFSNLNSMTLFNINEARNFRCNYGACIPQSAVCDGVNTCRDGSDESEEQCKNNRCSQVQFRCNYGGCLPLSYVCNGVLNCYDGSDETEELCSTRSCDNRFEVRCAYGACIRKNQQCNGIANCNDESDESIKVCGEGHTYRSFQKPITPVLPAIVPRMNPLPIVTVAPSAVNEKGCSAISPEGTFYELHGCGSFGCDGDIVPVDTEVTATCMDDRFYHLICQDNFRWVSVDNNEISMAEICVPEDLPVSNVGTEELGCSVASFQSPFDILRCGRRQLISDCDVKQAMPIGSILVQDCNQSETIMHCKPDQKWHTDGGPVLSFASCQVDVTRLANECGRTKTLVGEAVGFSWPFLVGLFKGQEYICTGTLISYNIVLTSGHCLTRNKASSSDFISQKDLRIQHYNRGRIVFTPVSSIHVHPQYIGGNRPRYDVAIIRLTRYATSEDEFEPACLDTVGQFITKPAVVFNRTEGNAKYSWTEFSQSMDLSCFNRNTACSRHLDIDENQYCGINADSDAYLHAGSSGGPYLIRVNSNTEENKWAIAGIVSHSVKTVKKSTTEAPCRKPHTIYASVFRLQQWISDCAFKSLC